GQTNDPQWKHSADRSIRIRTDFLRAGGDLDASDLKSARGECLRIFVNARRRSDRTSDWFSQSKGRAGPLEFGRAFPSSPVFSAVPRDSVSFVGLFASCISDRAACPDQIVLHHRSIQVPAGLRDDRASSGNAWKALPADSA